MTIAQLVERRIEDANVGGSTPSGHILQLNTLHMKEVNVLKLYVEQIYDTFDVGVEMVVSFMSMTDEQSFDTYLKSRNITQSLSGSSIALTHLKTINDVNDLEELGQEELYIELDKSFFDQFQINPTKYADNRVFKCEMNHVGKQFDFIDIVV